MCLNELKEKKIGGKDGRHEEQRVVKGIEVERDGCLVH